MDNPDQLTSISFCTGYGGLDLGLERALGPVRPLAYVEIDALACANLVAKMEASLLAPAPIWTDLKTFPSEQFHGLVDILTAGYPCQPFSLAGARKGKDDPRHLWPYIQRAVAAIRPRCVFFENVAGHVTSGLSDVLYDLGELGYRTAAGLFTAAECGAVHKRERIFILGTSDADRSRFAPSRNPGGMGRQQQPLAPAGPGPYQHGWEPPRTVDNPTSARRFAGKTGTIREIRNETRMSEPERSGGKMGNSTSNDERMSPNDGERRRRPSSGRRRRPQPPLGRNLDVPSDRLDYAELCESSDSRIDELRLCGNGVYPPAATKAFETLYAQLTESTCQR